MDNEVADDVAVAATNEDYPVVEEFKEPDEELSRKVESEVKDEIIGDPAPEVEEEAMPQPQETVEEVVEEPVNEEEVAQ